MNGRGLYTLFGKEVRRFAKVAVQTVLTPVMTAYLYLLVFGHALEDRVQVYPGVPYTAFLIPGLIMMSMIQNAFANSSSSLIQSKMAGNIVFLLLAPLSALELYVAFLGAAVLRGLLVGLGVYLVALLVVDLPFYNLWVVAGFGVLSAAVLGSLGLLAGVVSDKFEQLAAFQNFVVLPLTFLSGVFYSIHSLPPVWQAFSRFNPFFYMIDGFRYGFFGASDVPVGLSAAVVGAFLVGLGGLCLFLLHMGYKIRH